LYLGERLEEDICAKIEASERMKEGTCTVELVAPLSEKALDYIEGRRRADRKKMVKLTLTLRIKYLESKALVAHVHPKDSREIGFLAEPVEVNLTRTKTKDWKFLIYASEPQYSGYSFIDLWPLSGLGGPAFLAVKEEPLRVDVEIHSDDWVHDYAPKLGLGKYIVVEIPAEGAIKEVWDYVRRAEECFRRWDVKGVYSNCREVGSMLDRLIKKNMEGRASYTRRGGGGLTATSRRQPLWPST